MRRFLFAASVMVPLTAAAMAPALGATPYQSGASADDVEFLFRVGMLEGHLMVGRELLDARQNALALPHFGHPVRELYDDIQPWLRSHRVPPFEAQLVELEGAVARAPNAPETAAKYQAVIATLNKAREAAPATLRASVPDQIRICADTVEAAAGEYGEAVNRGRIDSPVEYHDSRGFVSWVAQQAGALNGAARSPEERSLVDRFRTVLARAQRIVGPLLPPAQPIGSVSDYRAVAADARTVAAAGR